MSVVKDKQSLLCVSAAIAALSLVLVGLGGFVRGTGAGLSCPDWPLCYGRAVPKDFGNGVAQEVIHRYVASAVSVLTVVFLVLLWRRRAAFPALWKAGLCAAGILIVQVVFGGLTVLMRLNPFIVTGHLALGTLFLQTFAFFAADLLFAAPGIGEVLGTSKRSAALLASLIFLQMLIGGFVGASGASLVCPDFPACGAQSVSLFGDSHPQWLHMTHRGVAVLLFLAVSITACRDLLVGSPKGRLWFSAAWFLVLMQIGLGTMNVVYRVPIHVAVAHLVVAQLILFCVLQAWRVKSAFPFFLRIPAEERAERPGRLQEAVRGA